MATDLEQELRDQIKTLRDENASRRTENKALKAKNAELEGKLTASAQKVTDLEGRVGKASPELQTRIDELTAENRSLKHKAVFRDRAAAAGVEPAAIDTLWRESGYKAEADEADPAGMDATIGKAKESHPFLFRATTADATAAGGATPPARPPLGGDRGKPAAAGRMQVTKSQMADYAFCHANKAALAEHQKAGTLDIDMAR